VELLEGAAALVETIIE